MDLAWSVDQADLEQQVAVEAAANLKQHENELDNKRLEKTRKKIGDATARIALLADRIADPATRISAREKAREDTAKAQVSLKELRDEEQDILDRISGRDKEESQAGTQPGRHADETEQEYLIRTGKITPFGKPAEAANEELRSHRDLARPSAMLERDFKRRKVAPETVKTEPETAESDTEEEEPILLREVKQVKSEEDYVPELARNSDSDSDDFKASDTSMLSEEDDEAEGDKNDIDDGNPAYWNRRVAKWTAMRRSLRRKEGKQLPDAEEWTLPHPTIPDHIVDARRNFRIPGDIWQSLFAYQKTGVRWLWELYTQKTGGIIGDEMGLGKTVQVAAFLAGLHYSGKLKRPAIIVCPATVLSQWVAELHQWWPPLRVSVLHSIGTGMVGRAPSRGLDSDDEDEELLAQSKTGAKALVSSMAKSGHVIVTTYAGVRVYSKYLLPRQWGYCCLDEGHKIRNPNSEISLLVKQFKTVYRLILSGTPIQNNLIELWSLFDFVFPGKLGTLPVFQNQFSIPINVGGYANASNIQVQTAYKCAVVLRNLIAPYLLRRMKSDVATDLPQKTEKVLFCKLTRPQREAYMTFLKSDELSSILTGKRQVLYGVDILRKVCNHPDLLHRELGDRIKSYGDPAKSGKMQVVKALLELWTSQDHRTLVFSQTRQMLDILEPFVARLGFQYLRMDGATPIGQRAALVDAFNNNKQNQVFLLTTKVGGLGVNLTGADRIIIYDPDWNPSTDMQARERAWRLGQKNEVMIYRLMIAGSIEEKIYHRQIFKQFLTNKILKDPKQKRFFKNTDLHDLFSLGDGSETGGLFAGTEKKVEQKDDISELVGIDRQDSFKTEEKASGDDGLLEGLFAKAGVQSTLEHDAIMEATRPDTVLMEREATRIANQAAAALKESRDEARKAKIGTPTWTGRFGSAGKAKFGAGAVSSGAASSGSILAGLRAKKELETKATSVTSLPDSILKPHTQTLENIRNYLVSVGNSSKSAEIVKAVGIRLDGDQAVANLRHMLKSIAKWDRDNSEWVLSEEFR